MQRSAPSRKAGDGQIESAPEQVNRAGFAEKGGPERFEHPVDRHQRVMEALNGGAVIGPFAMILAERHGVRHFVRLAVEGRRAAEFGNQPDEIGVERRHRGRPEHE
jgi:hypothetical protein